MYSHAMKISRESKEDILAGCSSFLKLFLPLLFRDELLNIQTKNCLRPGE